jgi:hypothetical protein
MNHDPSNKRLADEENYKTSFSLKDLDASLIIYVRIISDFIKNLVEDINVPELNQFLFITEKGVETLTHVFKMLLLYSKNVELTEYHTIKAGTYFIEFMLQLMDVGINVNEAIMFVYKKTIFCINNESKQNVVINPEQNCYFTILDETTSFFHKLIKFATSTNDAKMIMLGFLPEQIVAYSSKVIFSNDLTDVKLMKLAFINSLIDGLSILNRDHIMSFNILDAVLKKMMKMNEVVCFSMEKLVNSFDGNYSPLKTANQLLLT